ncbi:MAG: P-II family nitrogen regulator [Chthonomonas sp.]|nr:P-II family nitrogen regulator [Chthonomonas sp.]
MRRITAYIRPHRTEDVKTAVADLGVTGMTVSEVRGRGNSPESGVAFGGQMILSHMPPKAMISVVVPDELEEAVIMSIIAHAKTGEPGDGKIFVEAVQDAIRIRTKERGESAV